MQYYDNLRVVLYARFSSDNQRSESIDAQIRAMKKYCKDHHHRIIETYIDEAKSATTDKRPSFQRMIKDSKAHAFDAVIVHKLDRFSRDRYDSAMYKRELKKNGVRLFSVLENLDDSPESVMMEAMIEGMSEYYSKNLAREVMKGMQETAMQCKHTGGIPPLGFDLDSEKKLIINPKEAEAVRLMFELYDLGYGYGKIIDVLNDKGYRSKVGKLFVKNSIHDILCNEKYIGVYVYNRAASKDMFNRRNTHLSKEGDSIIRIPNGCPQIIDTELFERVQRRMESNKTSSGKYKAKELYLLSGLTKCGICGKSVCGNSRVSGRNKQRMVTYRCCTNKNICSNKEINKTYLENYVIDLIYQHFLDRDRLEAYIAKVNQYLDDKENSVAVKVAESKERLAEIQKAVENITNAIERGMMADSFFDRLDELEIERTRLEADVQKLLSGKSMRYSLADVDKMLDDFYSAIKNVSSMECKLLINDLVDKIVIDAERVKVVLNTGFGITSELNKTITAKRDKVYRFKECDVKRAI